ncbi:unnamed protein product [Rotaria sp. Silwood1]|nr:unnamed protein product [Rotaria sp. Silwood1]CAF1154606.1 unnamed protein product [Rotaria sp. Silwood1]CAF4967588.1 unnamed protein product [Rotaria sp. Silwood1]
MATQSVKPTGKVELSEKQIDALKKRSRLSEAEIRETFEEFRANAPRGQLTKEEFIKLWNETSPKIDHSESVHMAERVFELCDRDHSGKVDFNEFLMTACLTTPGTPTQKIAPLFILCDFNRDGFLQRAEIEKIYLLAKSTRTSVDQKEFEAFKTHLDSVFAKFDTNKDGKISHKEFRDLCTHDEVFQKMLG